jgi:hypothetical protein
MGGVCVVEENGPIICAIFVPGWVLESQQRT